MKSYRWWLLGLLCSVVLFSVAIHNSYAQNRVVKESQPRLENENVSMTPNEMGQVMILEYHLIGRPENQWRRTPENFLKDLEQLYREGYYPVTLRDLIHRTYNVPKGKTPVVLTFDDSSAGQFRVIPEDKGWRVDPESAVGIMMNFHNSHPDFPATATFFVLPAIPTGLRLFGQEDYIKEKLVFLRDNGFEIGNHSYWHQNLGKATPDEVQRQLALAQKSIDEYLPGYKMTSLALPFGVWCNPRSLAVSGEYQGIKYQHDAIVLVGAGPAPSPFSKNFRPLALPRIQAGDTPWGPGAYLRTFQKNANLRYFSDGKPDIISVPAKLRGDLIAVSSNYRISEQDIP